MKKLFFFLFAFSLHFVNGQTKSTEGPLQHVVIFKFKETSAKASVDSVVSAFVGLKDKIAVIKKFEWGLNDSP